MTIDNLINWLQEVEDNDNGLVSTQSMKRHLEKIKETEQLALKDEEHISLDLHNVSKRLSIKLEDWHYQCGDGCCDMYGTEIALNGKKCDNQYAGDHVRTALEFVLTELGYEVDIDVR